jgi:phytoene synthase
VIDARFVALMQFQIVRARTYYDRGLAGLRYLPRDSQFPIMVAARTYGGILTKIERAGYDVFRRRARTRRHEKLALAARLYAYRCYDALAAYT